jgi:hypothetical protein
MSWQNFLKDINKEKGGVGLNALQKAQDMGASKAEINAFLNKKDFSVGSAAQDSGFGKAPEAKETTTTTKTTNAASSDWEKFLKQINKEKGGVGLSALEKARDMGAGKSALNKFLEKSGYGVGEAAQQAGYGKKTTPATTTTSTSSWEDFLKGINTQKGGVGLSAIQQAQGMGASQDVINQFLGSQGYTIGEEARKAGFGAPLSGGDGTTIGGGTTTGGGTGTGTQYATDLDRYLAGLGTQTRSAAELEKLRQAGETERVKYEVDSRVPVVQAEAKGKLDLQKIMNSGYSNIARIERGSDMFRSIMGAFNF